MGCGKTSTAKILASKLNFRFLDMDEMLESKYRISIADLFLKYDEQVFRKLEQKILRQTFLFQNTVISTGGGTPCFEDNIKEINQNGTSIYLKVRPEVLHNRISDSSRPRPILQKTPKEKRLQYIKSLLKEREKYYLLANHVVRGENLEADKLIELLKPWQEFDCNSIVIQ